MPINPQAKLVKKLFDPQIKQIPTRNGFGEGLVEAGKLDENVVVLCADLSESTRTYLFKEAFPDRFVQFGVQEQLLTAAGAGMSFAGKVPFIASYATFCPGRSWEQVRTTIALSQANVKIAGAHAGVSVGPDGATHQMTEDIAIMRVLPNMTVLVPCDAEETRKATMAAAKMRGPVYLRFTREKSPVFTTKKTPFKIGKAEIFRDGKDVAIIGCGPLLYECLKAAEELKKNKIEATVVNCHTIKPIDAETIKQVAAKTGAVVTVEEHQVTGGLGGAVSEVLCDCCPRPFERVGIQDRFGESGQPSEIFEHFELTSPHIVKAVQRVLKKK
ncbi:MAG: transketolase C-terminal domain-containing protein [Candidatus Uhrbacteria bacterium]|nr:transketolase family protein [Patescibacteria group bacterium]MBU1906560.1 transketolase family protein [Patescibacteria group bacterium]